MHSMRQVCSDILNEVREKKDAALFAYTKKFDGADIHAENILVTEAEIEEAYAQIDENLLAYCQKSTEQY